MGAKGKRERPSERKAIAARANARRPRGRWANTPERAQLERAKAELRAAVTGCGADRLAAIIHDSTTPAELFLAAFRLAADRTGLPPMSHQDVKLNSIGGREVWVVAGGLGWPTVDAPDSTGLVARALDLLPPMEGDAASDDPVPAAAVSPAEQVGGIPIDGPSEGGPFGRSSPGPVAAVRVRGAAPDDVVRFLMEGGEDD